MRKNGNKKEIHGSQNITNPAIKEITREFFDQSTIHGVKYIATRPLHEKLWWLFVCIVSILVCVYQIVTIYTKWKANPVIITIDQKFTPIGEIPFPAVTICGRFTIGNETNLEYELIMKEIIKNGIKAVNPDNLDLFELASGMCYDTLKNSEKKNISKIFETRNESSINEIAENMFKANVSDFMAKCKGMESPGNWPCIRGFVKILNSNGVCFTFNMLQKTELLRDNVKLYMENSQNETTGWSPETGYVSKIPVLHKNEKPVYPYRTFTVRRRIQVKVKKYTSVRVFDSCLNNLRVYIHHPHDFPWEMENSLFYENALGMNAIVAVPEILRTPLELQKSLCSEQRNCFFDNERQLKFFKIYSKSNCEFECLTNITLDKCGCVQFWMPHFEGTPICGVKQYKCYNLRAPQYLNLNIATTSANILKQYDVPYKCNCLQRCNSITYSGVQKSSKSQKKKINEDDDDDEEEEDLDLFSAGGDDVFHGFRAMYVPPPSKFSAFMNKTNENYVGFQIEFEKPDFLPFKRIAPYEISDFIANCGGLLGLFMGISLLSIVEILYFCTFRFIEAVRSVKKDPDEDETEE